MILWLVFWGLINQESTNSINPLSSYNTKIDSSEWEWFSVCVLSLWHPYFIWHHFPYLMDICFTYFLPPILLIINLVKFWLVCVILKKIWFPSYPCFWKTFLEIASSNFPLKCPLKKTRKEEFLELPSRFHLSLAGNLQHSSEDGYWEQNKVT